MATTAATVRAEAQRRVRDPDGTATTTADVLYFLSEFQNFVNAANRAFLIPGTLSRTPRQALYPLNSTFTAVPLIRVERVRDATGRDLAFVPWSQLSHHDPHWIERQAERPQAYSLIGRDLILIYPTPLNADAVTVLYTRRIGALADVSTLTLNDTFVPVLLDMLEALLLARMRLFASLPAATAQITPHLGARMA